MENLDQVLDVPPSEERRLQYAGFWIRVAAFIIDYIIMIVLYFMVVLAIEGMGDAAEVIGVLSLITIWILYFSIMESSVNQATLGKMAVGIKVGDRAGRQISFGNALGRTFAKVLSQMIFYVGFMMAGWDDKKQGLHDKLADTYVFYK